MRAKTEIEVRNEFLDHIRSIAKYWAELPGKNSQERCDGVAFSILNIFDGSTMLPAMNISLLPHPEDKQYHIDEGKNWYEPKMIINDCMLHEVYFK
ncbi:MAG TPA: hypothetical protein VMW91_07705 [Desulfosporosinus sp.]|nr:hypothetical protein [Desulfosporosinus sp.]